MTIMFRLESKSQVNGHPNVVNLTFTAMDATQNPPVPLAVGDVPMLSGWFDATFAATLNVGQTYTLTLA